MAIARAIRVAVTPEEEARITAEDAEDESGGDDEDDDAMTPGGHYLPFGPYIVLGGIVYLFFGPEIIERYMAYITVPGAI